MSGSGCVSGARAADGCYCNRTRFGESEEVLSVLKSVREGTRSSPSVTFQLDCPAPSPDIRVVPSFTSLLQPLLLGPVL